MKALIWRYVVNAHSEHEMEPVTEDDVHELKTDLSSWRCELLDILRRNGLDIGTADKKEKSEHMFVQLTFYRIYVVELEIFIHTCCFFLETSCTR